MVPGRIQERKGPGRLSRSLLASSISLLASSTSIMNSGSVFDVPSSKSTPILRSMYFARRNGQRKVLYATLTVEHWACRFPEHLSD